MHCVYCTDCHSSIVHTERAVNGAANDMQIEHTCCCAGRDCTYYRTKPTDKADEVELHVRRPAPYLNMKNLRYKGVQIQPMMSAQR